MFSPEFTFPILFLDIVSELYGRFLSLFISVLLFYGEILKLGLTQICFPNTGIILKPDIVQDFSIHYFIWLLDLRL